MNLDLLRMLALIVLKILLATFVIGGFAVLLGAAIIRAYRSVVEADDEEDNFWRDEGEP